jgi:ubiquinone/menaquinone biosynthesis C-methylase UbiE
MIAKVIQKLLHIPRKLSKRFSRHHLEDFLVAALANVHLTGTGKTCLNIGSGGDVEKVVRRVMPDRILSVDIDPSRKPDQVADACDMRAFGDGGFDAVIMMEVLEHIPTPHKAIAEIRRVLKPEGKLILSVPFIFPIHDLPHDHFRFTRFGLKSLLSDFKNVEIKEKNDYVHAILVLVGRLMYNTSLKDQMVGCALFCAALLAYPLIFVASRLIGSKNVTTGYVVTATR